MSDYFKKILGIEYRTKYFSHALIYLFAVSAAVFALILIGSTSTEKEKGEEAKQKENPFNLISLEAKSAVVVDATTGQEIFAKNPDMPLPLASLTKLMTAIVAERKLDGSKKVMITEEDLKPSGDSKLVAGDTWKAKDLRDFTLITSSNDGAFALAAVAQAEDNPQNSFVEEMNRTAQKIGLLNTKFFNEHGLDLDIDSGVSGAYGSARDVTQLFKYTLKNYPEILEVTRYPNLAFQSSEKTYNAENTNIVINKIPNIIASKTGYTDLAGGNLVVAFDAGLEHPIIVSVLGSSESGRFEDMLKLVKATMQSITPSQNDN